MSTTIFKADLARHLGNVGEALGIPVEGRCVVMRSDESYMINGIRFWSANDWPMR